MATLYLSLLRGFMTIGGASQDNVAAVFINNMKIPVVTYNSYQALNTNEVNTGI